MLANGTAYLQIGEEGTEEFMNEVRPALVAAATDKSASLDTRAEVNTYNFFLWIILLLISYDRDSATGLFLTAHLRGIVLVHFSESGHKSCLLNVSHAFIGLAECHGDNVSKFLPSASETDPQTRFLTRDDNSWITTNHHQRL